MTPSTSSIRTVCVHVLPSCVNQQQLQSVLTWGGIMTALVSMGGGGGGRRRLLYIVELNSRCVGLPTCGISSAVLCTQKFKAVLSVCVCVLRGRRERELSQVSTTSRQVEKSIIRLFNKNTDTLFHSGI